MAKSRLKLKGIIPEFQEGHGITSVNILYHKLNKRTRMAVTDFEYTQSFLLDRVAEEISRIAGTDYKGVIYFSIECFIGAVRRFWLKMIIELRSFYRTQKSSSIVEDILRLTN